MSDENVAPHQDLPQPPVIPESSFLPLISETTTVTGQSQVFSTAQSLQESRTLRSQQDEEYRKSLLADQQKEIRKRALENIEERRRMAIKERCQRMADREEPSEGISLKIKYPDGSIKIGKFTESEPIKVLFDFVGRDEAASEVFKVQEAGSSTAIESTSGGLILDQGIQTNSTLYVLWMSSMDVEEWISHQMDVDQQQRTLPSTELLSIPHVPPTSSPSPYFTVDPLLAHTPIVIVDDDDNEIPVSPGLQTPETSLSPFLPEEPVNEINLQTILTKLVSGVDFSLCPTSNQINVCRSNILKCSLQAFQRRRFNPEAKLDVVFVDEDMNAEGSVDEGGPTREFLRLLMKAIHGCYIFEGHESNRRLALSMEAMDTKMYMWVAKMIAVCVVHGGVGPHFFSDRLYQQICGLPTSPVRVEDVSDHTLREQLLKIQEAATIEEANIAIGEAADSLSILGSLRQKWKIKTPWFALL
ncbi:uncharacterized protein LOC115594428 isoform X2 [Sparus aurata]|nr:uncharacterized protein LOC115594428 isoform X2 [Sparus aurata]